MNTFQMTQSKALLARFADTNRIEPVRAPVKKFEAFASTDKVLEENAKLHSVSEDIAASARIAERLMDQARYGR